MRCQVANESSHTHPRMRRLPFSVDMVLRNVEIEQNMGFKSTIISLANSLAWTHTTPVTTSTLLVREKNVTRVRGNAQYIYSDAFYPNLLEHLDSQLLYQSQLYCSYSQRSDRQQAQTIRSTTFSPFDISTLPSLRKISPFHFLKFFQPDSMPRHA